MTGLIVFLVAYVQSLVATFEVLCISHLKPLSAMVFGAMNSAAAFLVIYFIVVDANRLALLAPYVLGDVLATCTAILIYRAHRGKHATDRYKERAAFQAAKASAKADQSGI